MVINRGIKKLNIRRDTDNTKTLMLLAKHHLPAHSYHINMVAYNKYAYSAEQRIKKIIEDLYKIS